jgi:rod shape-determining protein MreD
MIAAALVQVALGAWLDIFGAFPNLVLLVVVGIAWTMGPRAGMAWACAGGLLLDLSSAGPLGPHALALLPGAYAIGLWARALPQSNLWMVALAAAATTLFYSGVLVLAGDLMREQSLPLWMAARLAVAAAVLNAVLAPLVFGLVRSICLGTISRRAQA